MSVNDKMQLKTGANILLAKVHINLSPTDCNVSVIHPII